MTRLPIPGSDDGTWGDILNTYLSVEHNTDGTLKLRTDPALTGKADDTAVVHLAGTETISGSKAFGSTVTAPAFAATGLAGTTATARFVGATTSGAPATGTFAAGDFVVDQQAQMWVCIGAGSPGTWVNPAALASDAQSLASGDEVMSRIGLSTQLVDSGTLHLSYFTARKTETVTKVITEVEDGAAGGATLARIGLYTVDGSGNLTLVASSANDTALWTSPYQITTATFTTPYTKTVGTRYAVGILWIGTTAPAISASISSAGLYSAPPILVRILPGQTDLPSSVSAASTSADWRLFWAAVQP